MRILFCVFEICKYNTIICYCRLINCIKLFFSLNVKGSQRKPCSSYSQMFDAKDSSMNGTRIACKVTAKSIMIKSF